MPRRKKIQKKISVTAAKKRKNIRFEISLVILIGVLTFSAYLLLISLNWSSGAGSLQSPAVTNNRISSADVKRLTDYRLKDASIDFEARIPPQIGGWFYKIGYVKSPVDETLSNQYVTIYVSQGAASATNNFDDLAKNILTIRQFSQEEWEKLEKGCEKGNQFYCETAGARVGEKNDKVFAYTKPGSCPKSVEAKCRLADRIIKSFTLK